MTNIIDLKPNTIIGDVYKSLLTLDSWKRFQSRQGIYGSQDKQDDSDGIVKIFVQGKEIDNVKITTQEQINAIKYLIDNSDGIRDALLIGLLKELPNLREIYEDLIPNIDNVNQFMNVLGLANLHVMSSDKENFAYIGFELGCDWDDEHGLGVMMHKNRVVAIGQADTSFDDWVTFDDNGTTEIETQKWNEANAKIQLERQGNNAEKPWWKFW